MTTRRSLLIDGDLIAFAACSGAQSEEEFEPFHWVYTCDHKRAWRDFKDEIEKLREATEATDVHVCITSATNFRKAVYAPYKGKRGKKPAGYGAFRERILDEATEWTSWMRPDLEADDVLGILMTSTEVPVVGEKVLWSGDKDLKQIPGLHTNLLGRITTITEQEGEWFHAYQTLVGDITDNYPGLPGTGAVGARKLLGDIAKFDPKVAWPEVEKAYLKAELTREDMLVQARVARMLRASDYDFVNKRPILWSPPS